MGLTCLLYSSDTKTRVACHASAGQNRLFLLHSARVENQLSTPSPVRLEPQCITCVRMDMTWSDYPKAVSSRAFGGMERAFSAHFVFRRSGVGGVHFQGGGAGREEGGRLEPSRILTGECNLHEIDPHGKRGMRARFFRTQ